MFKKVVQSSRRGAQNRTRAFSLVEMLMALLVASLLLAALAPVMTKRMDEAKINISGVGAAQYDKDAVVQIFNEDGIFLVPVDVNSAKVTMLGGGGAGGDAFHGVMEFKNPSSIQSWKVPEGVTKLRVYMVGGGGGGASGGVGVGTAFGDMPAIGSGTWEKKVAGEYELAKEITPPSTYKTPPLDEACKASGVTQWTIVSDGTKINPNTTLTKISSASNITISKVTACGGGGGGGGTHPNSNASYYGSAKGGNGGYAENVLIANTSPATIYVKVGGGGGTAISGATYKGGYGAGGCGGWLSAASVNEKRDYWDGASGGTFGGTGGNSVCGINSEGKQGFYGIMTATAGSSSTAGNSGAYGGKGSTLKQNSNIAYGGDGGRGAYYGGGGGGGGAGNTAYGGGGGGGPTIISTSSGINGTILFSASGGGGGGGGQGGCSGGACGASGGGGGGGGSDGGGGGGGSGGDSTHVSVILTCGTSGNGTGTGKSGGVCTTHNKYGVGGAGGDGGTSAGYKSYTSTIFGADNCFGSGGVVSAGKPGAIKLWYSIPVTQNALKCTYNMPANGGGGGGAGQMTIGEIDVVPGETLYFEVGAGGGNQTAAGKNGNNGGATYIRRGSSTGTIIATALGGNAGQYSSDENTASLGGARLSKRVLFMVNNVENNSGNWINKTFTGGYGGGNGNLASALVNKGFGGAGGNIQNMKGESVQGGVGGNSVKNGASPAIDSYGAGGGGGAGAQSAGDTFGIGAAGASGYIYIEYGGSNGGGGTSGEYISKTLYNLKPGSEIPITIGKGGKTGTAVDGTVYDGMGEETSFGTLLKARGGLKGISGLTKDEHGGIKKLPDTYSNYTADEGASVHGHAGSEIGGGIGGNMEYIYQNIDNTYATFIKSKDGKIAGPPLGGCGGNMSSAGNCNAAASGAQGKVGVFGGGGGGGAVVDGVGGLGGYGGNGVVIIEYKSTSM